MLAKCQLKSGIPFAIISDETDFLWPARCHSGWCHLLVEGPIPRGKIASWIGLPWKLPLEKTFSNSSVCFVVTPRKAKQNIAKPRPKKGMTLIIFPNIISTRSANSIWLMKKPVQTKQSLRFWEVPSPKIWHPSKKPTDTATPQLRNSVSSKLWDPSTANRWCSEQVSPRSWLIFEHQKKFAENQKTQKTKSFQIPQVSAEPEVKKSRWTPNAPIPVSYPFQQHQHQHQYTASIYSYINCLCLVSFFFSFYFSFSSHLNIIYIYIHIL